MSEYNPGDTVSKGQEELPIVPIILSSAFLYSFGLAKYSCNPFLLLSIIFLLGKLLYMKMQSLGLTEKHLEKKKGQTRNVNDFGQLELPGCIR